MSANERYTVTFDVDSNVYEWLMAEAAKRNAAEKGETSAGITFPLVPWTVNAVADAMLSSGVYQRIHQAQDRERLREILSHTYDLPAYEGAPVPEWINALEREV